MGHMACEKCCISFAQLHKGNRNFTWWMGHTCAGGIGNATVPHFHCINCTIMLHVGSHRLYMDCASVVVNEAYHLKRVGLQ